MNGTSVKSIVKSFEELLEIVERNLSEFRQNNILSPIELYDPVFYTLENGGKRIRPVLVLMGLNLFDDTIDDGIKSALAVEIFHNFTLLHDDIMDNSSERRSRPTVHKKWGANTAILSGDAMMILAYRFLAQSPVKYMSSLMKVFNKAALEVCEGQQFDINYEAESTVSEGEYIQMIRLKTSVLMAAALQMGAIIGGADKDDQADLYRFGLNLGLAFQLQDDYLDIFGEQSVFGKSIGNDIITNKKTYLLVKAFELSQGDEKEKLQRLMISREFDEKEKIRLVTDIYEHLFLRDLTKKKINFFHQNSLDYLTRVKVTDERKTMLMQLAEKLITRDK
jgi:geranylgeranyl diphosphate synthase, type II